MNAQVRLARTAGLYYLVIAILGGFAQVVRVSVYVPGDASTTAENVVNHADLVRLSFVADLVQATFAVFLVLALFRLLQHVHQGLARAMVVFVVIQVAITCLNMVHQLGALMVATGTSFGSAFGSDGSDAMVLLLLDLQHNGYLVAQIFFGLWLFPLGLLAYRSGMFPRTLGVVLMLATFAYLVDVALQFLATDLADAISPVVLVPTVIVAEVSMLVYLLARGVRPTSSGATEATAPTDHELVAH